MDLDPIFNHNLDEDFDFRASGITRSSFCSVYFDWIFFCYEKRIENLKAKPEEEYQKFKLSNQQSQSSETNPMEQNIDAKNSHHTQTPSPNTSKSDKNVANKSLEIVRNIFYFHDIKP